MTFDKRKIVDRFWYGGFLLFGLMWIAGAYYKTGTEPGMIALVSAVLMIAYGIWGIRNTDFKKFAHDAGEALADIKDGHGEKQ